MGRKITSLLMNLLQNYLWDKDFTLSWVKDEGLITLSRICSICGSEMKLVESGDKSDGYVWECRKQINCKRHRCERSIRESCWFEKANLTIEEVLKFTYWWCQDLNQWQIKQQLQVGSHTAVEWDCFAVKCVRWRCSMEGKKLGDQGNLFR